MLVKSHITPQAILILFIKGILLKNNDNLLYKTIIFTYQRKGNHELQIQALSTIIADLQTKLITYHQVLVVVMVAAKSVLFNVVKI